ncbi:MAG: MarR family transcriptional regulator [Endozoicomonadaceae bacterium]|nr:MarR family transcriptional regulator [Endozoicomonadaceae bacterium]
MKSQDIGLLLKLLALQKQERRAHSKDVNGEPNSRVRSAWPDDWSDWELESSVEEGVAEGIAGHTAFDHYVESLYTARALAEETGISKSQINTALNRCIAVGLAKRDRKTGAPRANTKALFEFIVYGLKYVFPARAGELTRGITTAFAAPVLNEKLMSAGELPLVWSDAKGNTKGQSVEPLFKSVTYAVRRDPEMYALLALIDSIRLGQPREAGLAIDQLKQHFELEC